MGMKKSCRRRGQCPLTGDELRRQSWAWTGQKSKTFGHSHQEKLRGEEAHKAGQSKAELLLCRSELWENAVSEVSLVLLNNVTVKATCLLIVPIVAL